MVNPISIYSWGIEILHLTWLEVIPKMTHVESSNHHAEPSCSQSACLVSRRPHTPHPLLKLISSLLPFTAGFQTTNVEAYFLTIVLHRRFPNDEAMLAFEKAAAECLHRGPPSSSLVLVGRDRCYGFFFFSQGGPHSCQ